VKPSTLYLRLGFGLLALGLITGALGGLYAPKHPNPSHPTMSSRERALWASTRCERCNRNLDPDNPKDGLYRDRILCHRCAR
jgi:hypothetical protein